MKFPAYCLLFSALCLPASVSAAPDWWLARQALDTNLPPNDYAPVLRGQLCWLSEKAGEELEESLPGGAGSEIQGVLTRGAAGEHDGLVNLGELKQWVTPFYRRLMEEGVASGFPWDGAGVPADYSPVNIGQVKQVFSFELTGADFNPSISGWVGYSGSQSGMLWVVANPALGLGLISASGYPDLGPYHLVVERSQTNWGVAAWRDADGDGQQDTWEPTGQYAFNPVAVTGAVNGVNLTLQDPDEDGDGLPGYVERQLGLDPEWPEDGFSDEDGDGLSLANEWLIGSDPAVPDSDGDGMGDGAEVVNGLSPTHAGVLSPIPFAESFELPRVACGELGGQNGWSVGTSNVACVASNPGAGSPQVLWLKAATNGLGVVTHPLATHGIEVVWVDFLALPVRRMADGAQAVSKGVAAAFYVNRDGRLMAYDSTRMPGSWICLSNAPLVETGVVSRFTVRQDYSGQRWGLWLNGSNVVRSLPFATRVPELARLRFQGAFYQDTLLDEMAVSSNAPAGFFVDSDGDGLPDEWERSYGFDPYNSSDPTDPSDPDFDALSNLQEYQLGLNPRNPDCDGDGLNDGIELALQTSPTHADAAITALVPFTECFEPPQVVPGDVNGQHDWVATAPNWAGVKTNSRSGGLQALCLNATTSEAARVFHIVKGGLGVTTWTDLHSLPVQRITTAKPVLHAASTAAFFFNASGQPVVASGTNWLVLTNAPAVSATNWSRFTVKQDFSNQVWSLCLNGRPIAENIPFVRRLTAYSGMRFSGSLCTNAWLDDIQVSAEAPGDMDSDGDGFANAWEILHGFDPADPTDPMDPDYDGDGLRDSTELARGLSPTEAALYHSIPYSESFEGPSVTNGLLAGQHGWLVLQGGEGANINTNLPYAGNQGLQLGGLTSGVSVYQPLTAAGQSVIWTDLRCKPVFRTASERPTLEPATTAGFYVDHAGFPVVSDSTNWVTLTNRPALSTHSWVRFTTCQDFSNKIWNLYIDGWPVATGLAFAASSLREYSGMLVKHGSQRAATIDSIMITSNRLDLSDRFPFSDWSDLSDLADPDHDGLANIEEYRCGTNPQDPDSDGDGMGDGTEVRHGFESAVSNVFDGLPFSESFEAPAVNMGNLSGQHGWMQAGSNSVQVQTNEVYQGIQAVALTGTGGMARVVAATGRPVVWTDFHARPVRRLLDGTPPVSSNCASAFFVNATGQVTVCVASGWETLSSHAPVSTSEWTRFTVKADYEAQLWALWIDGVCVKAALPFAHPVPEFAAARVLAPALLPGYFDSLSLTTNEPPNLDDDGDGLPNAWELLFAMDPTDRSDLSDPDFDGLSNLQEYWGGLSPRNPDCDGDGLVDGHDGVLPMGLFLQGVDRNGDGFADGEADYGCNPLQADTDGDGVADGVEVAQGMDPAHSTLGQGLVAWYRLDETNGPVIADSSTNHIDGVWRGNEAQMGGIGRMGGALEFDGLTNGISVPENALLIHMNIESYAVWLRPVFGSMTGVQMRVIWQGGGGIQLIDRYPEICLPGCVPDRVLAPVRLAAGEWTHLLATRSGSNVTVYVDGVAVLATNLAGVASNTLTPLGIGGEVGTTNFGFAGALDDVRFYNRALSPEEARQLYTLGADPDGDTQGTQDELAAGSDPAQSLLQAGAPGDMDGDGRVTPRDRERLQALVSELTGNMTCYDYDEEGNLIRTTDALGHTSLTAYNFNNRPVTLTDARGHITRHEVDAAGAVTAIIDPAGAVTRFAFNAFGNVTHVTDPAGNQTRIDYNAMAQVVRTLNSRGVITETVYDELGRVQEVIAAQGLPEEQRAWSFYDVADRLVSNRNQLGVVNLYLYDDRGLQVKEVSACGTSAEAVEETTYDERGLAVSWKDPRGYVSYKTYDALGRPVISVDALGNRTRTEYDNLGNVVATHQPNGRALRQEFDKWGRVVRQIDGSDQAITEYDVLNRITARSDWRGTRAEYAYDPVGNGVQTIEAKGTSSESVTGTAYDEANRPIRVTQANGGVITYAYDRCGNKCLMSNELGRVTRWVYQYGNRLAWTLKPDGVVVSNRYDSLDRLTGEWVGNSVAKAYQYDVLSRITNAVDFNTPGSSADDNRVAYTYDALNRVVAEWQNGKSVQRHFDASGNPDQLSAPSGLVVKRAYNGNNRLVSLKNGAGTTPYASYDYTPNGRVQSVTYANGVVETHGYDARERLSSLRQQGVNCDYQAVLSRDPNGNVTVSSESNGEGASYTYDAANRVTARKALNEVFLEALDYDPLGNWLSISNPVQGRVGRTINAGNQYTHIGAEALQYDLNGNLTGRGQAGYVYDYRGRLVTVQSNGVTQARYTYDAFNRRVSKHTASEQIAYYYDGEALVDESINGSWARSYVFADTIDTPVVFLWNGVPYYYLRDWRANIAVITDESGHPVEQFRYSLFGQMQVLDGHGNPLTQSGLGNIWTFTARQWDPESGLLHYRNRAYSAELGRFLQQDPDGYKDGMNLYAYAGNNPLLFSDPYGLYRWNHGALEGRIGEWIVSQYGQLREIERQRREYEEALRRAEEERRRQQQAAKERAARALSRYQSEHTREIRDMVRKYRHLGVNEREATQLLMSGVSSIPRLGASVGPNDMRRGWWLDYYLRGGEINDVMQGEMNRMGTSDVDQYFATTSARETQLRNKRKAKQQQYSMAAVAIVATVVTCGAGGVLGAAMLGTVGMTATASSFGAFVMGAVAIQGVASAATTLISQGNAGDFAQSWALNSAASVAGYGAGFSTAKAGGEVWLQTATQSASATLVASGTSAALEGGGFGNVIRDTAISFVAGGVMGTFMSAPSDAPAPARFGDYVQAGASSSFGYLHSPISGGVRGGLRAGVYGGNMVEAFGEGAVSRDALLDFTMSSTLAPVASRISAMLVEALPGAIRPVAKPEEWVDRAPAAKVEPRDFGQENLGLRVARGSTVTVLSHLQEMGVAPARSLLAIYRTGMTATWKERSRVINPFSRSFAGYQAVDGVVDAALVAGGLPISFLSGDFLESRWNDNNGTLWAGLHTVNFNGMANTPADAENMRRTVAGVMGEGTVAQVSNSTHGWMMGDILQALGNELGLIDITAIRGAAAIRGVAATGASTINVTAHSQGSMTFRRALDLVDEPAIRGRIRYQGFGAEAFISKNYLGLKSADNYWNRSRRGGDAAGVDPIPFVNFVPAVAKVFGDPAFLLGQGAVSMVQSPHNRVDPQGNHHGVQYYAGYMRR